MVNADGTTSDPEPIPGGASGVGGARLPRFYFR